ncbi:MSHA biogenesis protein MshP [Shewanella sp. Isolate8]|uniref:MSHA biogenesis protein MshP n=1 Tax=Shewanella sp. Isolate8 TaxID=2908529 RepID=UPI001EFC4BF0|nr:MSHA biogenesis protein MshP [Shewanella sp. Isolate8]MCG9747983.1 MSHA biogenesis protein MshP [Shewanella sp. Isolate8]
MFLNRSSQRGSALVIGIFIITVMFLMAAALINIVSDADEGVNLEVLATRAFAAANSGADAAMAQLFPLSGTVIGCSSVSASWTPPNVVGFHGCSVALSCNQTTVTIGSESVTQYLIGSEATCAVGNCDGDACLRVNRKVEVEARE